MMQSPQDEPKKDVPSAPVTPEVPAPTEAQPLDTPKN